jgi:hypothetical protein
MTLTSNKSQRIEGHYYFKHGGLMRCCLGSLDDEMLRRQKAGEPMMVEGQTLACQYHDGPAMICKPDESGELWWQWNR